MSLHAWTNPTPKSNSEIDMTTSRRMHRGPRGARWELRAMPKGRVIRRAIRTGKRDQVVRHLTRWGYHSLMKISIRIQPRQTLSWASETTNSISSSNKSTTVKSAAGSTLVCWYWVLVWSWSQFSMDSKLLSHPCLSCWNLSSICWSEWISHAASNLLDVKSTSEIRRVARFVAGIFSMHSWWRSAMESSLFPFSPKLERSRASKRLVKKVLLSCGASGRHLEWFWSPKSKD